MTMGKTWQLTVAKLPYTTRERDAETGALVDVRHPAETVTVDESAQTADMARRMCAARFHVGLGAVTHVMDESGQPSYREYEEIQGMYGRSYNARFREDE